MVPDVVAFFGFFVFVMPVIDLVGKVRLTKYPFGEPMV